MAAWTRHPLSEGEPVAVDLSRRQRCVAIVDLPGVPAGTKGRVLLANGFTWRRFHVLFDNGVDLANLDGRHLAPVSGGRGKGATGGAS